MLSLTKKNAIDNFIFMNNIHVIIKNISPLTELKNFVEFNTIEFIYFRIKSFLKVTEFREKKNFSQINVIITVFTSQNLKFI